MKTTEYSLFKRPGGAISGNNPYYEVRWSGNILGRVFRGEIDTDYWYGRVDDMIIARKRTREGVVHVIMNLTTMVDRTGRRRLRPRSMVPGGPSVAPKRPRNLRAEYLLPSVLRTRYRPPRVRQEYGHGRPGRPEVSPGRSAVSYVR